jgi:cytochrome c
MQRILNCLLALLLSIGAVAQANERGDADDAQRLAKKAIVFAKKYGRQRLLEEAGNRQGQLVDRDLYLTITDMKANTLVNGNNAKLNGKNVFDLRDADGKYFVRERLEILKSRANGWIDYRWPDPVSGKIAQKSAYFERYEDLVIACGFYKQ